MRRCVLSPRAEGDLNEIWRFTLDQWGLAQAEAYIESIKKIADAIAEHPQRGVACDHIRAGYRKIPAEAHIIFYRVTGQQIEIVRILHRRMDWEIRL